MRPLAALVLVLGVLSCTPRATPEAATTSLQQAAAPLEESTSSSTSTTFSLSSTSSSSSSTTSTSAPAEDVVEIEVEVEGERIEAQRRVRVDQEDRVRLEVEADVAEHVHVHGYDLFADVGPQQPAVIEFVADVPGIFEVELEDSHRLLFELEVTP